MIICRNTQHEPQADYMKETLRRVDSMGQLIRQLEQNPGAEETLKNLYFHFHGLADIGKGRGSAELRQLGRLGEFDSGTRFRLGGTCSKEELFTWKALLSAIEATALQTI